MCPSTASGGVNYVKIDPKGKSEGILRLAQLEAVARALQENLLLRNPAVSDSSVNVGLTLDEVLRKIPPRLAHGISINDVWKRIITLSTRTGTTFQLKSY